MPWLVSLAIAAALSYATTAMVAGAPSRATADGLVYSEVCAGAPDRMLVYAVTTHRVPASISPECEVATLQR